MSQYKKLYCDKADWAGGLSRYILLYRDRQGLEGLRHWVGTQKVYRDLRGLACWGCLAIQLACALQHGQPGHDTAAYAPATRLPGPTTRPGQAATQPGGHGHDSAPVRVVRTAYARRLGCVCAHCAFDQFLTQCIVLVTVWITVP